MKFKLKHFLKAAKHTIAEGYDYQWRCYPDAHGVDTNADAISPTGAGCIYNTKTQEIYEISVHFYNIGRSYRWVNPNYLDAMTQEAARRGVDMFAAYDDVLYCAESFEEILMHVGDSIECNNKELLESDSMIGLISAISDIPAWSFPKASDFEDSNEDFSDHGGGSLPSDIGPEVETTIYEVVTTVRHKCSVNASSMEEAAAKAKEFVNAMKPSTTYPVHLCWEDTWISKETVTRRLESLNIDDN